MSNPNSFPGAFQKTLQKQFLARGFTLVELAIVMGIVAILMVGVMQTLSTVIASNELKTSEERLRLMRDRIVGYVTSNQRLPAYAAGTGTDELTSLVPDTRDKWGRKFVYIYDTQLSRSDVTALVCAKKNTNLILRYCDDAACLSPRTQSNVAFLAFSSGRNLVNQTGASTTPHTESITSDASQSGPDGTPGSPRTITIYGPGTVIGAYSATTISPVELDDLISVVTLEDLRTKLNCQGTPLRLVNNDLPTGAANTAYSATIYADGGVPVAGVAGSYRWCVETSVPAVSTIVTTEVLAPDNTTATALALSASGACSTAAENTWTVGQTFRVKGATAGKLNTAIAGTYDFTVYVRDDQNPDAAVAGTTDLNDNIISRKYVLGINGS